MLVDIQPDELGATIGSAHGVLRQHPPDLIWLVVAGSADIVPGLLLTRLVGRDREGHQLFERHAIVGIDVVQLRRHGRQTQALLDDRRRDEVPRGDILFTHATVTQQLERAELIEWMQAATLVILAEGIVLGDAVFLYIAGHTLRLRHIPLLKLFRARAGRSSPGWYLGR